MYVCVRFLFIQAPESYGDLRTMPALTPIHGSACSLDHYAGRDTYVIIRIQVATLRLPDIVKSFQVLFLTKIHTICACTIDMLSPI